MSNSVKATAPRLEIATRGRGRPRAAEPGYRSSTWLPESTFDKLTQVAKTQEMTVSEVQRKAVEIFILNVNVVQVVRR